MKKLLTIFILITTFCNVSYAKVKIIVSYSYIKDITERIGRDKVMVTALGNSEWDPHYIVPRPSYIARAENADLLIINGAQLEIGWIPPIITQSNNPKIVPGRKGLLDLSNYIKMLEIPSNVSRAMGDVHPAGNPHFELDPGNIPVIASAIMHRLSELDPVNAPFYQKNSEEFNANWKTREKKWEDKMKPLRGAMVIQYHKLFDYFLHRYGLIDAGNLEPLPGIPPTSKHIEDLLQVIKMEKVKFILQDVYHSRSAAKYLSQKTGVRLIVLPHDVNAVEEAKDIYLLFDEIIRRLTQ